ncbi:MAG: hypothetical protein COB42_07755 [Sulfurimonas sp.]|nr:MAG: hypothetical protein COB42_07755 [Sulfurimonas sp.]
MNKIRLSLVAALLATTGTVSMLSANEIALSANVAMTSNYVWRGMTQSDNSLAIQGGADISYGGLYAGVWASNVDFDNTETSSETDLYFGYGSSINDFSYDINYIQYIYAGDTDNLNFGEISLTVGYDFGVVAVSAKYYKGIDTNDVSNDAANGWEPGDGWEIAASVPLPMDISLDATYGDYDDEGNQNNPTNNYGDYYSVGVTKTFGKFDATLAYTGIDYDVATNGHDNDGKEANLVLTVGTSF